MEDLFQKLKSILSKYETQLEVVHDDQAYYYLNTLRKDQKGKPIFFAMIKSTAKKVSFHLMPIYCDPNLIDNISPELKKRMQGKSCFNFTQTDQTLFDELDELVLSGFESFVSEGKI